MTSSPRVPPMPLSAPRVFPNATRYTTIPVDQLDALNAKIAQLTSSHLAAVGQLEQVKSERDNLVLELDMTRQVRDSRTRQLERSRAMNDEKQQEIATLKASRNEWKAHTFAAHYGQTPATIVNQFLSSELSQSERCHASSDGKCCGEPAACALAWGQGENAEAPDDRPETVREARWRIVVVRVPEDHVDRPREPLTLDLGERLPEELDDHLAHLMSADTDWKCISLDTGAIVFHVDDVDYIRIEKW